MAFYVVVVGAGSAGCAVVNRLCQSSDLSICLVEAGPDYGPLESGQWPPELLDCHRMACTHDWGYSAQGADGSTVPEPRAKVIAGCSAHNQCGAFWGLPADYDAWVQAGNQGWSFAELTSLIQQIERAPAHPSLPYRGHDGLIQTRPYRDDELASWHRLFLDTALRSSFAWLTDLGAPDEPAEGIAPYYANIKGETRWNAAFAFLDPVRQHPGLTILANTSLSDCSWSKTGLWDCSARRRGRCWNCAPQPSCFALAPMVHRCSCCAPGLVRGGIYRTWAFKS